MITNHKTFVCKLNEENFDKSQYLYHGTTDAVLDDIMKNGLKNPYLTDLYEKAVYYSIEASEDSGGEPVVLKIKTLNKNLLRVDFNELNEPVVVGSMIDSKKTFKNIQKEYKKYIKTHPDTYDKKYDTILVRPEDYFVSLNTVHSVSYNGTIKPEFIDIM